ncbi:mast/stem cell growth factor receptor-related protein Kit-like [Periplaneta americana]|uniref:mast/stem cell growth factor receptor-related protein Kit-like n=1 Tax=Periplaneta americana TaxID=6978 RepID=UPI0037E7F173
MLQTELCLALVVLLAVVCPGTAALLRNSDASEVITVPEWQNLTIAVGYNSRGFLNYTCFGPSDAPVHNNSMFDLRENKSHIILHIRNIFYLHAGNYSLLLQYNEGTKWINKTIIVIGKPFVTLQKQPKSSFMLGSRINFLFSVRSHPPFSVWWNFTRACENGSHICTGEKYKSKVCHRYEVKNYTIKYSYDFSYEMEVQFNGTLTVTAENSNGTHNATFAVVTRKYERQTNPGTTMVFSCEQEFPVSWCFTQNYTDRDGMDTPTLVHTKNGTTYKSVLTINKALYTDTGYYYCINATKEVKIEYIISNPSGNSSAPNNRSFSNDTLNDNEVGYNEEEFVSNDTVPSDNIKNKTTIILQKCDLDEDNKDDKRFLHRTYIYVKDPEHHLVVPGNKILRFDAGNRAIIPCRPSSEDVIVTLSKLDKEKKRHEIKVSDQTEGKNRSVVYSTYMGFRLRTIKLEDHGEYFCRAYLNGVYMEVMFLVEVQAKPEIIQFERLDFISPDGSQRNYKCLVYSPPPVDITMKFKKCNWTNEEGCKKSQNKGFKDIGGVLHKNNFEFIYEVTAVVEGKDGILSCIAKNAISETNMTTNIYEKDDQFNNQLKMFQDPKEVVTNSSFTLVCESDKAELEWFHNHAEIKNDSKGAIVKKWSVPDEKNGTIHKSTLQYKNVTNMDHKGYYDCYDFVNLPHSEYIIVEDPRDARINKSGKNTFQVRTSDRVSLYCPSTGVPTPNTTWFKDGFPISLGLVEFTDRNSTLTIIAVNISHEGKYKCQASNKQGPGDSREFQVEVTNKPSISLYIGIIVVGGIILAVLFMVVLIKSHKERMLKKELYLAGLNNFEEGQLDSINPELTVEEQADLLPYDQSWEFPREKLRLGRILGSGAFGVVMRAEASGIVKPDETTTVAVKMVKGVADRTVVKALATELKIMGHLGRHLNIVNFLGAWTKNLARMELMIIVEYCRYGSLHEYLLVHREDFVDQVDRDTRELNTALGAEKIHQLQTMKEKKMLYNVPNWRLKQIGIYQDTIPPVSTEVILCWAFQVSCGMNYLASRKVLHGDLALRNILLADGSVVKICDFGLSSRMHKKGYYRKQSEVPLPIKWMAPESLCDQVFSTQSDVWSFGIVLWEFFSLAKTPYPEFQADDGMYMRLVDGYRMTQPRFAPDSIYKIMRRCWDLQPDKRPSFAELVAEIGVQIGESRIKHYLDLNKPYEEMNELKAKNDLIAKMSAPDFRRRMMRKNYGNIQTSAPNQDGYLILINNPKDNENKKNGENSEDVGKPKDTITLQRPAVERKNTLTEKDVELKTETQC